MGYIASATTTYLDLHLSEKGRELLVKSANDGSLSDAIITFAIGDTDEDYRNTSQLSPGFVPDVTGSHNNCIFGVNTGVDIQSKVRYVSTGSDNFINQEINDTQMVLGFKNLCGDEITWTSRATVNYYLHDHLALGKVVAMELANKHNFSNFTASTFTSYFNRINDASGTPWSQNLPNFYNSLQRQGKSVGLNVVDYIFVREAGSYKPENVKLKILGNNSALLFSKLFGGTYISSQTNEVTQQGPILGSSSTSRKILSTLAFTNNTFLDNSNRSFLGAGPLRINISGGIDYGYLLGKTISNTSFYQEYGIFDDAGGFYNIRQVQTASFNQQFTSGNYTELQTLVPAARMILNENPNTNKYYILQKNQIDTNNTTNFTSQSGSKTGRVFDDSTNPLKTLFGFLVGTPSYTLEDSTTQPFNKIFTKSQPSSNREPFTGLEDLINQTKDLFEALYLNPTTSTLVQKTGSGNSAKYTVPLDFEVLSNQRTNVQAANLRLNVIFDLSLLYNNFKLENGTATTPQRSLVYDVTQNSPLFYGDGLSGTTINPLDTTTTGGTETFRKIIYS